MQDFPTFLQDRGLTLPDYHKLSAEKQQYLKETWQLEEGGSRAKRYGIEEGRESRRSAAPASSSSSMSMVWLCLIVAALGAGIWLFVLLVRGTKNQVQANSGNMPGVSAQSNPR